jgi:hypothetical protein
MKKLAYITFTAILCCSIVLINLSFIAKKSDCGTNVLYEQTIKKLSPFSLLKDYRVYLKNKKKSDPVEIVYYPITLNRGVKYKFLGAQSAEYDGKLNISLYTVRNGKPDFLFATNYMKDLDKTYESIEFDAESTMNCLIAFSFKDGKEGCGVGVSSFLKN